MPEITPEQLVKLKEARRAALSVEARGDDAVVAAAKTLLSKPLIAAVESNGHSLAVQARAITRPPLYMGDTLIAAGDRKVILCQGEASTDAVLDMVKAPKDGDYPYAVIGIPSGCKQPVSLDWEPIRGRSVLILSNGDSDPLMLAALVIGKASEIHTVNLEGMPVEWTPAEALAGGWTQPEFYKWLTPRIRSFAVGEDSKPIHVVATRLPREEAASVQDNEQEDAPASCREAWGELGLALNKQLEPVVTIDNICRLIEGWPAYRGMLWWDTFHRDIRTTRATRNCQTGENRQWTPDDTKAFEVEINRYFGLSKFNNPHLVKRGLLAYATSSLHRNEPRDWMETLVWDEKPRINRFLTNYTGATDSEYITAVSKNLWISIVARIYKPGCKYDQLPYLKGKQGKLKSTLLEIIGGKWYAVASSSVSEKDFFQCLHGQMLLEVADLHSIMGTKADRNRIKMVLSSATDRYRASYGEVAVNFPRQSVFIGTTNEDRPLSDPTGNRRFWPIQTHRINLEATRRDRDQLFAEAVSRFKRGESWWETPDSMTSRIQEEDYEEDAWEDPIQEWLSHPARCDNPVSVMEVAEGALSLPIAKVSLPEQRRIATILRRLDRIQGWDRTGGKQRRVWVPMRPASVDPSGSNSADTPSEPQP